MLQYVINKTYEVCDELINVVVPDSLGDLETNAFDVELTKLMICMKLQILEVLQPFLSFMHGFDKKRGHNMLVLILDPSFKNMWLVANYCGCEYAFAFALVKEYDVGLFMALLVQCYKMMMLVVQQVEVWVGGLEVENKDLFQTSKTNAESMSQIDAFCHHCVNVENYKCALSSWHIHEQRWPLVGSLAQ
jgi:hypothetical protein